MFWLNPLKPELNPICYMLALLGAHHFLHVSRIRVKLLTFRLLMSYIYDISRLRVNLKVRARKIHGMNLYIYIYIYIYTHTHTHTHTYALSLSLSLSYVIESPTSNWPSFLQLCEDL